MRRYAILGLLLFIIGAFLRPEQASKRVMAQDQAEANHVYTWREAAMTLEYPADWLVGDYAGNGVIASTPDALEKATQGQAPGAPFLSFLFYPQARTLDVGTLLGVIFPGVEGANYQLGVARGLRAQWDDEANAQTLSLISFESPATRTRQILVAGADETQWGAFVPTLETVLSTVRFLRSTATLEIFGSKVGFRYNNQWVQSNNGQVMVVAPNERSAAGILAGNIDQNVPFVRAQLLIPSGVGVDPASDAAADEILVRFLGLAPDNIEVFERFMWAEDMPAASAWFELDGVRLVMIAVVHEDTALVIGGGAPAESWARYQADVLGALDMATFKDIAPTRELTLIATGRLRTGDTGIIG